MLKLCEFYLNGIKVKYIQLLDALLAVAGCGLNSNLVLFSFFKLSCSVDYYKFFFTTLQGRFSLAYEKVIIFYIIYFSFSFSCYSVRYFRSCIKRRPKCVRFKIRVIHNTQVNSI